MGQIKGPSKTPFKIIMLHTFNSLLAHLHNNNTNNTDNNSNNTASTVKAKNLDNDENDGIHFWREIKEQLQEKYENILSAEEAKPECDIRYSIVFLSQTVVAHYYY